MKPKNLSNQNTQKKRKRIFKRIGQVRLSLFSTALIIESSGASAGAVEAGDAAKSIMGS